MLKTYKNLLIFGILLAFCVISLGAYVRLSDAGLGCPDWPGCYGKLLGVPDSHHEVNAAQAAFPHAPVEAAKAWKEMIHRYLAGILGLVIAALAVLAIWPRRQAMIAPHIFLVGLVLVQAALGMLTVTWLLKPVIVTLHLLGGMLILATLVGIRASHAPAHIDITTPALKTAAWVITAIVLTQIALGGWTSANYAAMACSDYPLCQGQLMPADMDWSHAFVFNRELGQTSDGQMLSLQTLTAIHWTHRSFALIVLAACVAFAMHLKQHDDTRQFGQLLLAAVVLQVVLGISNVWLQWPLGLAVLHNTGAAILLAVTVYTTVQLQRAKT
ncbi:MAG: cytochrome c oxidase assembly protein subunit 15 [Pseudomonadota bacterium]